MKCELKALLKNVDFALCLRFLGKMSIKKRNFLKFILKFYANLRIFDYNCSFDTFKNSDFYSNFVDS